MPRRRTVSDDRKTVLTPSWPDLPIISSRTRSGHTPLGTTTNTSPILPKDRKLSTASAESEIDSSSEKRRSTRSSPRGKVISPAPSSEVPNPSDRNFFSSIQSRRIQKTAPTSRDASPSRPADEKKVPVPVTWKGALNLPGIGTIARNYSPQNSPDISESTFSFSEKPTSGKASKPKKTPTRAKKSPAKSPSTRTGSKFRSWTDSLKLTKPGSRKGFTRSASNSPEKKVVAEKEADKNTSSPKKVSTKKEEPETVCGSEDVKRNNAKNSAKKVSVEVSPKTKPKS